MNLNQVFELSTVLDNEHFQKVFVRSYNGEDYIDGDSEEYIDRSISNKGITVIYRDSQYKKKIRLIVNTYLLLDDVSDTGKLIRKLDKRIAEYFDYKYHLEDFVLSGMNFISDIDVDTPTNVQSYLKVFKRIGKVKGFSPASYECFEDNFSFCLSGNSNAVDFLLYDLADVVMRQHRDFSQKRFKFIKGVIRSEVRLTKPKAICAFTEAADIAGQIEELLENSRDIFMDIFTRVIPFGDFYKKDKADEIIRKEVSDSIMRRRMLRLLVLIPEKKSVYLAQKAMNCRNIEKVMETFARINLSPVTISKRSDCKFLKNIYSYME